MVRFAILVIPVILLSFIIVTIPNVSADVGQGECARSDITSNVTWFQDRGIDQPENWINQPSSQRYGIYTYVVWQGGIDYLPCINRYNHVTNKWDSAIQLASFNPISPDGHGAPALFITNSGKILVVYGAHISTLKYIRGDVNTYPNGFTQQTDIVAVATYPHFVFVQGRIWLFYRQGDACSTWGAFTSSNDGSSWVSAGSQGFAKTYIGGLTAGEDGFSIYFNFVSLINCGSDTVSRNNTYIAYFLPDLGNAFWCKSFPTDTQVGFTLPDPIPAVCRIEFTSFSNFGMVRKIGPNINESLGTVYAEFEIGDTIPTGNWQYRFYIWIGGVNGWTITNVSFMDHYQDYSDFRIKSSTDIDTYVLGNYTDFNNSKEGGILNRYNFNGSTWTFVNTILSPVNSSGNLLSAPFIPFNGNDEVYFDERIVNQFSANSKLYLWSASIGFEGLIFIGNSQTLTISNETWILLAIAVLLTIVGFRIPIFWLFATLAGFFGAFFVFRDIQSVPASSLIVISSLVILFLFMAKAIVGEHFGGD